MSLLEMFCNVDDFCQQFERQSQPLLSARNNGSKRQPGLCISEMITIVLHFHQSGYRTFKDYYTKYVQVQLKSAFPKVVSYNRFIQLMPRITLALWAYVLSRCGRCTGISFIDSTALRICHNRRIKRNKVFKAWQDVDKAQLDGSMGSNSI